MESEAIEDVIIGRVFALPGNRSVFVGERTGDADSGVFLQFKNKTAVARFVLSREAANGLQLLLTDKQAGEPKTYPVDKGPSKREWQLVSQWELDA